MHTPLIVSMKNKSENQSSFIWTVFNVSGLKTSVRQVNGPYRVSHNRSPKYSPIKIWDNVGMAH